MSTSETAANCCHWSASTMAWRLTRGEISSLELVEAHVRRIEEVNPLLNAVVVTRFDAARDEARQADAARARGQSPGPLQGVPITVKECFHVEGTAATAGVSRFAGQLSTHDGPLVRRLRRAGAIILGKTNVPQLMLMHETDNPLYGCTKNPWHAARSPGGSSGGEAAIIAAGGSPLGLANDLGGSIRQPAHSCGICGIKPTTLRLTNAGVRDNLHGLEAIRSQAGPLARSVEDLYLGLRVLTTLEAGELDPQIAPVPLGDPAQIDIRRLRIGTWVDDEFFSVSPAIRRAVEEAAAALAARGAQVVPFRPHDMTRGIELYFGLMSADGGADAARILGRGPRDRRIEQLLAIGSKPAWMRRAASKVLDRLGQRRTAELLRWIGPRSADNFWQLSAARAAYAEVFFRCWSDAGLDAIVCPPHALVALEHGSSEHLALAGNHGYWANLLGVPAGVVPATRVRPEETSDRAPSKDRVDGTALAVEQASAGLPVGVQVAARPWREDVVLALMGALESHFRTHPDFPHTPVNPFVLGGQ